jgi:hypothetical protein
VRLKRSGLTTARLSRAIEFRPRRTFGPIEPALPSHAIVKIESSAGQTLYFCIGYSVEGRAFEKRESTRPQTP